MRKTLFALLTVALVSSALWAKGFSSSGRASYGGGYHSYSSGGGHSYSSGGSSFHSYSFSRSPSPSSTRSFSSQPSVVYHDSPVHVYNSGSITDSPWFWWFMMNNNNNSSGGSYHAGAPGAPIHWNWMKVIIVGSLIILMIAVLLFVITSIE